MTTPFESAIKKQEYLVENREIGGPDLGTKLVSKHLTAWP